MELELRELLDKQAIAELHHAYGEAIDRRDGQLLESVFTADCRLHYGAYDQPARVLIDSWRDERPPAFLMTHHLYGNLVVRAAAQWQP
ncbi:MAG: nuclear transport factor 2 family protein [Steroidobacteraceae bacterium]